MVGQKTATEIKTTQTIPYESLKVIGTSVVPITQFEDTGVTLTVKVPRVVDDDGNWSTNEDTYILLDIKAEIVEEGQRIVVALDVQLAEGDFLPVLSAPEFVSRSIETDAWVRHGQVLILGGLFRNTTRQSSQTELVVLIQPKVMQP